MSTIQPPSPFNFEKPSNWPEWRKRFERYRLATKLKAEDGPCQVSTLIYTMGGEAEQVYAQFTFPAPQEGEEDPQNNFDIVIEKFEQYFLPKRNLIYERSLFHHRDQKEGESAEAFIRVLYQLAENCDFGVTKTEYIKDRLVDGMSDKVLSTQLQLRTDLTLDKAVEIIRYNDLVKSQNRSQGASAEVDAVYSKHNHGMGKRQYHQKSGSTKQNKNFKSQTQKCTRCGYSSHPPNSDKCPALKPGVTCRKCLKRGHFSSVCRTRPTSAPRHLNEVTEQFQQMNVNDENDTFFLGSINVNNSTEPAWFTDLTVCDTIVRFKIDSGADVTVIGKSTFDMLKSTPQLQPVSTVVTTPAGQLDCLGEFMCESNVKGNNFIFRTIVSSANTPNLLSRAVAVKMGFIARIDDIDNNEIFGDIGLVKCKPVKITLQSNVEPYSVNTSRRIPIPLLEATKLELARMQENGIIRPVTEPTDWCAAVVPVVKKNNKIRICADLRQLNKAVKRERYCLPVLEDVLHKLARSKVFTTLDASSGFWQIPLDEQSQLLTTFITPFGRFCYQRLPFGITSAPEIYQRIMSDLLKDLPNVVVIADDILVHHATVEEHDDCLQQTLRIISGAGLKLNKSKCKFRQPVVDYMGHTISANGVKPQAEKVKAITDMLPPKNTTELKRFFGMINYLGRYLKDLSSVAKPLSDLLKKDVDWCWNAPQQNAFDTVKTMLTSTPVLAYYEPHRATMISADASSYGLGSVIMQKHIDEWKPVAFASRTLTDTEKRYSQIEKECLASVWACEKFQRYLIGMDSFQLITDHKPLVPLINDRDLDKVPSRLQRLLTRMMAFHPVAIHTAGKDMVISDTLSRCPLSQYECELSEEVETHVAAIEATRPISGTKLSEIRQATAQDNELQKVIDYIKSEWPRTAKDLNNNLQIYHSMRHRLSFSDGLLTLDDRIVIPQVMRKEVLSKIHEGHQGISKCRDRASYSVWWPHINTEIQDVVTSCRHCQSERPTQQREPLKTTPLPSRPWEKIGMDLLTIDNKKYISVIDYYSRFIEIEHLPSTTAETVIDKLKGMFSRWGYPTTIVTDNGPPFNSAMFAKFASDCDIEICFSSPYMPNSNGAAERSVQIAKKILRQDDIHTALLSYRSTPIAATGVSPAQLMMGRRIRTSLPSLPSTLKPKWPNLQKVAQKDAETKAKYEHYFNTRHGVKPLSPLQPGDNIVVKLDHQHGWGKRGVVIKQHSERSYIIKVEGALYRRNRRHLRKVNGPVNTQVHAPVYLDWPDNDVPNNGQIQHQPQRVVQPPAQPQPQIVVQPPVQHQPPAQNRPQVRRTLSGRVVRTPKRYLNE